MTAAADHAEALVGKLPEDLLARHPGIRAQVLSARGAAELRAGRLDEAVATFKAAVAAASGPDTARTSTLTASGISRSWRPCAAG